MPHVPSIFFIVSFQLAYVRSSSCPDMENSDIETFSFKGRFSSAKEKEH